MAPTRSTGPAPRTIATPAVPAIPPEHPLDQAVRHRNRAAVPEEHRADYESVLLAFQKYEAGDDEAARTALQAIGLRSPFLDWKVLIRGLMAYSAGDDTRALENWQRLAADRLPARLAAPLRTQIDTAFAQAQPAATREHARALIVGPVAATMYELRTVLSSNKPMSAAFRLAERALGVLRSHYPDVIPRLSLQFYRLLLTHGEPEDLPRFRRVLGHPPNDPDFHLLEGMLFAQSDKFEQAIKHFAAFESWLASTPPGWPQDVARRARAIILSRMANIAVDAAEESSPYLPKKFASGFFGNRKPRVQAIDPVPLWRKSIDLAPDWELPASELFDHLRSANRVAEAEVVARSLLDHNPNAAQVLDNLAEMLARSGRAAEVLDLRTQALTANPLDKKRRVLAAYAYVAAARRKILEGDWSAAATILDTGKDVCEEYAPAGCYALRFVIEHKSGRKTDADAWFSKAIDVPGSRLAAALYLATDSTFAKLKPADKKPASQLLTSALAGPATSKEALLLYAAWDRYHHEGLEYRGQQSQEKKIQAVVLRSTESDGTALDFELLTQAIEARSAWALLQKLATKCYSRFPKNPLFPLMLAMATIGKAKDVGEIPAPFKIIKHLDKARVLAEQSTEPRHQDLLPTIQELEPETFNPFFGFFP